MHPYPGTLIIFEGTEGSGKSTCSKFAVRELIRAGYEVVKTHEPGGGDHELRELIFSLKNSMPNIGDLEICGFSVERTIHYLEVVIPALKKGSIVVSDRGPLSMFAYQGPGRNPGNNKMWELIRSFNRFATRGVEADITLFLDLPVEIGLARVPKKKRNRFEEEGVDFHNRVRHGFCEEARVNSHTVRINTNRGKEVVLRDVMREIHQCLEKKSEVGLQACS